MGMKIFLAGATGAAGQALIPLLTSHGHSVIGTTRSASKVARLRELGAEAVVVDGLDRDGVRAAVAAAQPDAVIHEMTALSGDMDLRKFEQTFAATNRLRTEGTDILVEAARENGVERIVAQSYGSWPYIRTGGPVKTEDDPLDPDPPKQVRTTLDAIKHTERVVTEAGGIALRYGGFYGPGTGFAPGAEQWDMVLQRKFPIVGDGGGVWSFAHIDDVASGTLAALERGAPGQIYNITDDEPAPVREWLPFVAKAIGAPPPRHIPRWVGSLMGRHLVVMMCEVRGASNERAKRELGWEPTWPTWREGMPAMLNGRQEVPVRA
jgi:nucleoside-diphosphate-sugar epimerase